MTSFRCFSESESARILLGRNTLHARLFYEKNFEKTCIQTNLCSINKQKHLSYKHANKKLLSKIYYAA